MERYRVQRFESRRRSRAAASFLMNRHDNAQIRRRLLALWMGNEENQVGAQIQTPALREKS